MGSLFRKYKKSVLTVLILVFILALVLDIKFEGLFYQFLPRSVQEFLSSLLG